MEVNWIRNQDGYLYFMFLLRLTRTPCCLQEESGYFDERFTLVEIKP